MMPLGLMTTLTNTIHDGECNIANHIASHWQHDADSVRFFRASANFLFTFKTEGQARFLRFNHADERTLSGIEAELDFLKFLATENIQIATPIRSNAGNHIESIDTDYGTFHTVVFQSIAGEQFDLETMNQDRFARWGNSLGKLHNAAQKYCGTGRPTWEDQLIWVDANLPAEESAAQAASIKLKAALHDLPILSDNFGLIHFDFELDNVIWNEHGLGIVDFDDCAWHWLVADVAFALRDLVVDRAEQLDINDTRVASFLDGYRAAHDLPLSHLAQIPLFLHTHHLITFTKLLRALALDAQPQELTWVTNLRQKLLTKAQQYRDEFAAYVA